MHTLQTGFGRIYQLIVNIIDIKLNLIFSPFYEHFYG